MKSTISSSSRALSSLLQGTSFPRSKNRDGKNFSEPVVVSKKRARSSDGAHAVTKDEDEEYDEDNDGNGYDEEEDDVETSSSLSLFSTSKKSVVSTTRPQQRSKEAEIKSESIIAADAAMRLFRKKMGIRVLGEKAPNAFSAFKELPLNKHTHIILTNIEASRYKEPTPVQMQALPALIMRRDILACAPTGTGKTAAFLLPILSALSSSSSSSSSMKRGARALIVVPTTELAQQTKRAAEALGKGLGLRTSLLCRAQAKRAFKKQKEEEKEDDDDEEEEEEEDEEEEEEEEKDGGYQDDSYSTLSSLPNADILVCTPKRLSNLICRCRSSRGSVCFPESLLFLIFDEADRLLEPGSPTRIHMDAVIEAAHSTAEIRGSTSARLVFGMFTATVSTGIEELANSVLNDPLRVFVGARGAAASSIKQSLLFVGKEEGKIIALRNMVASGVQTPALVFVQSKVRGEDVKNALADQVGEEGAGMLHGDLSPSERNSVVQRVRRGTVLFLVATDLAARGLDFPGVKTVINFDFPTTGVQYIHRIGRTGRGGRSGEAVTFFVENDIRLLRTIANVMRISGCDVPEWMLTLRKLERKAQKRLKTRAVKRSSFNGSLHGSER